MCLSATALLRLNGGINGNIGTAIRTEYRQNNRNGKTEPE